MRNILKKLKPKNKKVGFLIISLFILLAGIAVYFLFFNDKTEPIPPEPQKYYSKLTGIEVSKEESEQPILGVMIENSEEARPQTGLDSAGIVFEAVTEGGITRYLALYQEEKPELFGPIRSIRTHFLDWAMGFDASIAHVGGSAEALALAESREARSMNQFTYADQYYRDETRFAPHNMYAKSDDLVSLQKELDHSSPDFNDIPWTDEKPVEPYAAKKISIDFSAPIFAVDFRYDSRTNLYTRYLAGEPHLDAETTKPITVSNVVVIKTVSKNGGGVQATGTGEALVFNNGRVIKAKWELESYENRIKLMNSEGIEIALIKGDTWIAAPTKDRDVKY